MDEVMGENDRLIQIKSNRKQQEKEEDLYVAQMTIFCFFLGCSRFVYY